jgi:hypothetical protein
VIIKSKHFDFALHINIFTDIRDPNLDVKFINVTDIEITESNHARNMDDFLHYSVG